jgi:hypothetical protein
VEFSDANKVGDGIAECGREMLDAKVDGGKEAVVHEDDIS